MPVKTTILTHESKSSIHSWWRTLEYREMVYIIYNVKGYWYPEYTMQWPEVAWEPQNKPGSENDARWYAPTSLLLPPTFHLMTIYEIYDKKILSIFFWNYVWIPPFGQWYCFLPDWWSVLLWIKLSCFDGHFGTSPPSPPPCPPALLLSHLFPASPLSSSQGQEGEEDCGI